MAAKNQGWRYSNSNNNNKKNSIIISHLYTFICEKITYRYKGKLLSSAILSFVQDTVCLHENDKAY